MIRNKLYDAPESYVLADLHASSFCTPKDYEEYRCCKMCGTILKKDDEFCPYCGQRTE